MICTVFRTVFLNEWIPTPTQDENTCSCSRCLRASSFFSTLIALPRSSACGRSSKQTHCYKTLALPHFGRRTLTLISEHTKALLRLRLLERAH